uniref:Guanylate kinase 1 n=1 Tax=Tetraselmis sp. GSL018 TaxID=582737 RepID=A0A061SE87_9CHLO
MGTTQSGPATSEDKYEDMQYGYPYALVVCGPSGVGKGTLIKALAESAPDKYGFSVSHTTRQPRPGEKHGEHYYFVTKEEMLEAIDAGMFLEYAEVHGHYYGTSIQAVSDVIQSSRCCILDIDVQGARLVRASNLRAIFCFVAPPDAEELGKRLRARGTESEEAIQTRVANAKKEMESIHEPGLFDFLIVNDDLESAKQQLIQVGNLALTGQDPSEIEELAEGSQADSQQQPPPQPQQQQPGRDDRAQAGVASQESADPGEEAALLRRSEPQHEEAPKPASAPPEAEAPPSGAKGGCEAEGAAAGPSAGGQPPEQEAPAEGSAVSSWVGKVAVVTGASSGIGHATVLELLRGGVRVVAVARRRERLEKLQVEVYNAGTNPADFLPIVCDITKEAEVLALPRIIAKRWPGAGVDILVNNAGINRDNASLIEGSTTAWVEMISTNVLGLAMCTREAVNDMMRRGAYGHVINIGQMDSRSGSGSDAFYHATKNAVRCLTDGLRAECDKRSLPIRITLVSPLAVQTELARAATGDDLPDGSKRSQDTLAASDIAAAVVWCLAAPPHVDVSEVSLKPTGIRA